MIESNRERELKDTVKRKSKEQAYIEQLNKQIAGKQAELDESKAAIKSQKKEEKLARIEKLILERNTSQQTMPNLQPTSPISTISRLDSSKSETTGTPSGKVSILSQSKFRSRVTGYEMIILLFSDQERFVESCMAAQYFCGQNLIPSVVSVGKSLQKIYFSARKKFN